MILFIKPVARTTKTLSYYSGLILLGFVLNLFDFEQKLLLMSILLALGWLAYLSWYSSFKSRDTSILKIGNTLPDLTFENTQKEKIAINSLFGSFKVFIFYRGNWCPLCMAQIKEIVTEYKELEKRNIDVVLVSSQPHEFTESLAKKHKVSFNYL